ncbi:tmRNA-binding protein SmpB [hydrothermal vent metagenome]|uniref:TmRNA-binding protein SmpB n=1 Tax=hydrothermal vent metagenome TaxID=652676 RepID=A0A3B0YQC3_9ZZZZ
MASKKKANKSKSSTIVLNKRARYDYYIEEKFESGLVLEGWEVKSLREGQVQLGESYVFVKEDEVWITGCVIAALPTVSTHITPNPNRTKKLLLHRREIDKLIGAVERKGYTLVATAMYWKKNVAKVEIGIGKGKKEHDKRAVQKDRDWNRDKSRLLKSG